MIKKEKFKLVWQSPPLLVCDACTMYKLLQLNFKKEQTILIPAKHNHKCSKEINLSSPRRFYETFLIDFPFKVFLLKMKKSINLV